jgi:hypothetical protein
LGWKKHQVYQANLKLGAPLQHFPGHGEHPITHIHANQAQLLGTQLWQQQSSGGAMSTKSLETHVRKTLYPVHLQFQE